MLLGEGIAQMYRPRTSYVMIYAMRPIALAAALWLGAAPAAWGASFACEKAATLVEKTICGDTGLEELDEHLGRYYSAARDTLGAASACIAKDQRDWLSLVRNRCKDAECLKRVYLARLAELDALQPGVTAIRNIELPRVKQLQWVIAPAEDTVAAPRDPQAMQLIVEGRILDEVSGGDGYVIQDPAGGKHLLLTLMFITDSSAVTLETLAKDSAARYEASGFLEVASDGSKHFAPGACTFIYRLPG